MKFLLFNLSVISALIYLFNGGGNVVPNDLKVTASQVIGNARAVVEKKLGEIKENNIVAQDHTTVLQEDHLNQKHQLGASNQPVYEKSSDERNIAIVPETPVPLQVRSPTSKPMGGGSSQPPVKFMSPGDRHRELQKLVRDMEGYFLKNY